MDDARPTVLIVDDHPPNIHMLAQALMDEYDIVIATSGPQALDLAMNGPAPDLVLLDILMPGMSGYEVCQHLKAERWTRATPVIFVTAKDSEADETRGLDVGAVDYITKPISVPIVRARVRAHIELKRHRDRLENLLLLDGLTGIANRRGFDQLYHRAWRLGRREKQMVTVIMTDIDHFKAYNDRYGHLAGDECLRRVAKSLARATQRPMDLVARYGGEEFVGIFFGTSFEGGMHVGDKMRREVEELGIEHGASPTAPYVTISVGTASLVPSDAHTATALLGAADDALYAAKTGDRNAVRGFDFASGEMRK